MNIWAFVDYENVGSLEALDLTQYQRLIVFCGPRHRKLNLGEIPTDAFSQFEVIRMESTGKNNLDFHLAFYLGLHHQRAGKSIEFHVVSNDTGFDGVIKHMGDIGRPCKRIRSTKKKVAKKAAKKTAKKVAKKAIKKVAAKKAVKKISVLKDDVQVFTADAVAQKLKTIESRSRPATRNKLINWLAELTQDRRDAELLFERLNKFGFIDADATKVTYML